MSDDSRASQEPSCKAINTDECRPLPSRRHVQGSGLLVSALGSSRLGSHGLDSAARCHMCSPATSLLFTAKSLHGTQTLGPCAGVQKDLIGLFVNSAKQLFKRHVELRVAVMPSAAWALFVWVLPPFINREECLPAKLSSWQDGKS